MPLEELPESKRTCENCGHTQCAGRGTALHPKWCVFWMEAVGSVETRAEKRIAELEARAEKAERERDEFKQAWLTVCHEGNVPQYEHAEDAHPEGILHGVRQLACLWSGERSLRERAERERDEAVARIVWTCGCGHTNDCALVVCAVCGRRPGAKE